MRYLLFSIAISLFSFSVSAGDHAVITAEQGEGIHTELRALRDTMQKAMNEQDIETILANVDENVVFSTINGDVVHGRDNLNAYFEKMMKGTSKIVTSVTMDFIAEKPSILHEDDVAIAFGHSDGRYELAVGETLNVNAIWSATMLLRDGAWKIANFHYSVNVFDNPLLDAQKRVIWFVAILGLVLILVAFLLGRRVKRT